LKILRRHFGYIDGVYIASCFYDIYENRHNISFLDMLRRLSRRSFVVRYLFNIKTFSSSIAYLIGNLKNILPSKS
jgi:hypothetical protein